MTAAGGAGRWRRRGARTAAIAVAATLAAACAAERRALPPIEVLARSTHCEGAAEPGARRAAGDASVDAGDRHRVRLTMGRRPTGGYAIDIVDPTPFAVRGGVALIRVEWRTPGPDAVVTQALTAPCIDVAVPRRYAGVRFVDGDGRTRGRVPFGPEPAAGD